MTSFNKDQPEKKPVFSDPEEFLRDYWQKKPLLIRQAFPGFEPELDADDIAGLACDELAESRLITGSIEKCDWQVRYGPFSDDDFSSLPDRNWTLLVQDVEKHYPPLQNLLDYFAFIPSWRIDDLMVSVAGRGGSVGPHVDQYDVFLLQASGRRRWQIAEAFEPGLLAGCELEVLEHFRAEQEWTLEPGDLLYLPPGVAHFGVALDPGATWSIGMRAPGTVELYQSLGDWLAERDGAAPRYRDPGLVPAESRGQIEADAVRGFQQLAMECIHNEAAFSDFLGAFLSRYRLAHDPAPPAEPVDSEYLRAALRGGATLRHNPWTRLLWMDAAGGTCLFAAGERLACDGASAALICDPHRLAMLDENTPASLLERVHELVEQGHLYLETL
ncbi:MAG: cupin domain-containing protein [Xanthomonadales bacterium]|nr:cupin domain-containing protein [Xanthomonadales bacterium]